MSVVWLNLLLFCYPPCICCVINNYRMIYKHSVVTLSICIDYVSNKYNLIWKHCFISISLLLPVSIISSNRFNFFGTVCHFPWKCLFEVPVSGIFNITFFNIFLSVELLLMENCVVHVPMFMHFESTNLTSTVSPKLKLFRKCMISTLCQCHCRL